MYDGRLIVDRHRDPEHAACRALLGLVIAGKVLFMHKATSRPGMFMDIAKAATVSIADDDRAGIQSRKYVPFLPSGVVLAGEVEDMQP